jgi:hypothetical protein
MRLWISQVSLTKAVIAGLRLSQPRYKLRFGSLRNIVPIHIGVVHIDWASAQGGSAFKLDIAGKILAVVQAIGQTEASDRPKPKF